jgi:hypothetical protein
MTETIYSKKTFVLDSDRNVVAQPDVAKWALWLDWAAQVGTSIVKQEEVGGAWISTVFLGLDTNHFGGGGPILFETVAFRKGGAEYARRYRTWAEAEEGHEDMAEIARMCGPRPTLDMEEISRIAGNINEPLLEDAEARTPTLRETPLSE